MSRDDRDELVKLKKFSDDFTNGNQKIFYSNGVRLIHVTTNAKISDGK